MSLREASQLYNVPLGTLSGWVDRGLIRIAERPERRGQPLLVFKTDIVTACQAYRPGRGHHNQKAITKEITAGTAA